MTFSHLSKNDICIDFLFEWAVYFTTHYTPCKSYIVRHEVCCWFWTRENSLIDSVCQHINEITLVKHTVWPRFQIHQIELMSENAIQYVFHRHLWKTRPSTKKPYVLKWVSWILVVTRCPLSKRSFPFLNSLINKWQHEKWIFHPFLLIANAQLGYSKRCHFLRNNRKLLMILLLRFNLFGNGFFCRSFDPYELWTMLFKAHVVSSQAILHSYLSWFFSISSVCVGTLTAFAFLATTHFEKLKISLGRKRYGKI